VRAVPEPATCRRRGRAAASRAVGRPNRQAGRTRASHEPPPDRPSGERAGQSPFVEVGRRVPHPRARPAGVMCSMSPSAVDPDDPRRRSRDRSAAKIGLRRRADLNAPAWPAFSLERVSTVEDSLTSDDAAPSPAVGAVWVCAVDRSQLLMYGRRRRHRDGHDRAGRRLPAATLEKRSARFRSSVAGRDERTRQCTLAVGGESLYVPSTFAPE